jgi:hypothetical protein
MAYFAQIKIGLFTITLGTLLRLTIKSIILSATTLAGVSRNLHAI